MGYKKIFEFLLWDNCKNNCKFCFQRDNPRLFNKNQRAKILDDTISFINSDKFEKGSHVLICGGEIFDTPSDSLILNNFFTEILNLMAMGVIDLLYINTNLIYKDLECIDFLLRSIKANGFFNRLRFTTSYDTEGRFKSKEDKQLMLSNLKWVKKKYPECNIVTNTILTKNVCRAILDGEFSVKSFMEEYQCWVNLIPYIVYDQSLSANRAEIFSALQRVEKENKGYLEHYVPNITIEQEKDLFVYRDGDYHFCSCELADCGHSVNFKRYSTAGTCFCCDLKEVFSQYA